MRLRTRSQLRPCRSLSRPSGMFHKMQLWNRFPREVPQAVVWEIRRLPARLVVRIPASRTNPAKLAL